MKRTTVSTRCCPVSVSSPCSSRGPPVCGFCVGRPLTGELLNGHTETVPTALLVVSGPPNLLPLHEGYKTSDLQGLVDSRPDQEGSREEPNTHRREKDSEDACTGLEDYSCVGRS